MNKTIPGQTTPTLNEILIPITNEQDDDLLPFEFIDPPKEDFSPDPGDLLDIKDFFKADVAVMKLIYLQDLKSLQFIAEREGFSPFYFFRYLENCIKIIIYSYINTLTGGD